MSTTFIAAAGILLREGLEAILVLVALATYLGRSGGSHRLRALWTGAGLAVVVSIGIAWVFEHFYNGAHSDTLEAVLIFFTAGLMFYVSGWLYLKQDPRHWQAYLKAQTEQAVAANSALAVGALAFFAVAREGGETVLFLHTLANTSGGWVTTGVLWGVLAAAVGLVALFVVIYRSTRRLPLRFVFLATSAFLFVMGLKFIGEGFQELQEQALISYSQTPLADRLTAVGLNPTWEAVSAQMVVLMLALSALLWARMAQARTVAVRPQA